MLKSFFLSALIAVFFVFLAKAQNPKPNTGNTPDSVTFTKEIKNVKLTVTNPNLCVITYELNGSLAGELYDISVFSSVDGFQKPLVYVSGDVGTDVKSGRAKKIYWKAQTELESAFDGQLSVEVRAKSVYSPLLFTQNIPDTKRGKNVMVAWNGSRNHDRFRIDLYRGDSTLLKNLTIIDNSGTYTWKVPSKQAVADDYKIRITSLGKPSEFTVSNEFVIKNKIPLFVKLIPAGVAALTAVVLIALKGDTTEEDPDLPAPPAPRK